MELLIPTLKKILAINSYLLCGNYEQSPQNNQCTWCSPQKYGIFSKTAFHEWTIFFGEKIYGEVLLNRRTNDQIMSWFGKSFVHDKCIFQ